MDMGRTPLQARECRQEANSFAASSWRNLPAAWRRCARGAALSLIASIASVLCGTRAARAEEPGAPSPAGSLILGAAVTLSGFQQASGSPPLCCAERDNWRAYGPELHALLGVRAGRWLVPSLDLGVGFLGGTGGANDPGLDVSLRVLRASPTLGFHLGDRLFVEPRVAIHALHVSGRFEASPDRGGAARNESASGSFVGPGLGLAAGFVATPLLSFGVDAAAAGVVGPGDISPYGGVGFFARFTP
jgi:hypothetical protein